MWNFDRRIKLVLAIVGFVATVAVTMPRPWRLSGAPDPVDEAAARAGSGRPSGSATFTLPAAPPATGAASAGPAAAAQPPADTDPQPEDDMPAQGESSVEPPPLPVRMSFQTMPGGHRAGRIASASAKPLTIEVDISHAGSDGREQRTIHLAPRASVSVGEDSGWNLASGDQLKLHAEGYASLVRRVL